MQGVGLGEGTAVQRPRGRNLLVALSNVKEASGGAVGKLVGLTH